MQFPDALPADTMLIDEASRLSGTPSVVKRRNRDDDVLLSFRFAPVYDDTNGDCIVELHRE